MAGKAITLTCVRAVYGMRAPPRLAWRVLAVLLLLQALLAIGALLALSGIANAAPDPIKGDVTANTRNGYARLIFRFAEEPEADVRVANGIIIISFKKPVDVSVDRLSTAVPGYVGAARRDPDGAAVRIALARKVTVNSMTAGEQLFVDLLPEGWTGLPPGLPQEVVEELARRAREAEKKFRLQQQAARQRQMPPLRVRVGTQPTFTRYVFELPELVAVTQDRSNDRLTLAFDAPWRFDLADALAALPPTVSAITSSNADDTVAVRFDFVGKIDVRTFREDNNFVVDVSPADAREQPKGDLSALVAAAPGAPPSPAQPPAAVKADATPPPAAKVESPPSTAPSVTAPETPPSAAPVPLPVPRPASAPHPRRAKERTIAAVPPAPAAAPPVAQPPDGHRDSAPTATPAQVATPPPRADAEQSGPPVPTPPPPAQANERPRVVTVDTPAAPPAGAIASSEPAQAPAEPRPEATPASPAPAQAERIVETPPAPQPPAVPPGPQAQSVPAPVEYPAPSSDDVAATPTDPTAPVFVQVRRQSDALRLVFPFAVPTAAAVFRRADTLWLVFDTAAPVDISKLILQPLAPVRSAAVARSRDGQVVRIKLDRPKLASLTADGSTWTVTIGDMVLGPTQPLAISRAPGAQGRTSAVIPLDRPQQLHRLSDPDVGDTLLVVTAFAPARGFLKAQSFVEFGALSSTHGIALQTLADDLSVELVPDKVVIGRTTGLTLSSAGFRLGSAGEIASTPSGGYRPFAFDAQLWGFDQHAEFQSRQSELMRTAAAAPAGKRAGPRLDLARFYLARGMYYEAKGVLDVTVVDGDLAADDPSALVLRAVAHIMMGRGVEAMKDLAHSIVGNQQDATVWRALALAQQGKWAEAREGFRGLDAATAMLPVELQRLAFHQALRAAIEVGDFADAGMQLHELETLGIPPELEPTISILRGRLAEGLGRIGEAQMAYEEAARSSERRAAAQGQLRLIELRMMMGDLKRAEAIPSLETLTMIWRGDDIEAEALQLLGRLYTEEGRYRDAFHVMRTALAVHPGSEMTRRLQDEAAASFDVLFLSGKADSMPAIDALSLFYDYRELTPPGRRGDEMIRRLADRLVSVDLLDQAAALLQHQVDHRLQGAARAQIAIRLAVIYLMARKPDRALEALRSTRTADLPNELRNQRLLLEARALSDTGRRELAIEVVSNIKGREAERLRADILWSAKRWREAAEQIERLYGERWRDFAPLTELERADIMRAAIGYALADDVLGLDSFRQKYSAKMAEGPDRHAFDVVTTPFATGATEFAEIAKAVSQLDTLDGFLRDMRARYPDTGAMSPAAPPAASPPQTGADSGRRPS
jgi:tetratricopeptide (TPR) repeat protein